MYVIVQRDSDNVHVYGPYHSQYGANYDIRHLEEISPEYCYKVHRLNLPKTLQNSATNKYL
jgi:hypothetical protein